MTTGTLDDAISACKISLANYKEAPVIVNLGGDSNVDDLLLTLPGMEHAAINHIPLPDIPELQKLTWRNSSGRIVSRNR